MSSDLKDARWEYALRRIEDCGMEWDGLTGDGKQKFLDDAQTFFEENPTYVSLYAGFWRERE